MVRFYRQTIFSVRNVLILMLFPTLLAWLRQDHSMWLPLVGFVVLVEVMRRYLPKLSEERVPATAFYAVLTAFGTLWAYFRQESSLWLVFITFVFLLGMCALIERIHRSRHWEIRDDCVVERRYFHRIVFPFSEIAYVGPMTGAASQFDYFNMHILIRNASGEKIIVSTPQYKTFLQEMRKRLPLTTLNL